MTSSRYLALSDGRSLPSAHRIVSRHITAVERAVAVERKDAEVRRIYGAAGRPLRISALLADIIGSTLEAARLTNGAVDPTVDSIVRRVAHTKDTSFFPTCGGLATSTRRAAPGWQQVSLQGRRLQLPAFVSLDLSAIAGAWLVDESARDVVTKLHTTALVQIGSDAAVASTKEGAAAWRLSLPDGALVSLVSGEALSTTHAVDIVDPTSGRHVDSAWRSITVHTASAVEAKTRGIAAMVDASRGVDIEEQLAVTGVAARLVTLDGLVRFTPAWVVRHAADHLLAA